MLDMLFGWRKANKCKRLIRKVQCRLKLLKNKRCTIVRQLRDDVAQLLKQGHFQTALDRVEHVFKDETLVAVYDLLDQFCEFIIINLPYIRKNKDCPNDINEAASTIIFVSARLGELPELLSLRKLFGERYGQRFTNVALQLLPGNLVNRQMQEKVCLKKVPDEVKSRLVTEIARSNFQSEPLLIEYSPESQQNLATKSTDLNLSIATQEDPGAPDVNDGEKETVYFDFSSEAKKLLKYFVYSFLKSKTIFPLISPSPRKAQCIPISAKESSVQSSTPPCLEKAEDRVLDRALSLTCEKGFPPLESSSDSSANFPEETVVLDDIHEFKSVDKTEVSLQDKRVFMFGPSVVPLSSNAEQDPAVESDQNSAHESDKSRSFKKSPKVSGKRSRGRTVSIDIKNVKDVECEIYYGESCANVPYYGRKPRERRRHLKNIPKMQEPRSCRAQQVPNISVSFVNTMDKNHGVGCRCSPKNTNSSSCSLENPCYFCTSDETDATSYSPGMPKIQCTICYHKCTYNKKPDIQQAEEIYSSRKSSKNGDVNAFLFSSSEAGSHEAKKESKPSYSRAATMPVERPNDGNSNSCLRSNSFPAEQLGRSPLHQHVHPKLPDYDELAAKFTALKKANLLNQTPPRKIK